MVKKTIKEKKILKYLEDEGFEEIKASEKSNDWYIKAAERPSCLTTGHRKGTSK